MTSPLTGIDAMIFDLEGVVTDTASVHARAGVSAGREHGATLVVRDPGELESPA